MPAGLAAAAAAGVLAAHLAIILFNVFGLVAIPLGGWRGWRFVRVLWWRLLHVGLLAVVAMQAWLGQACILTIWQSGLAGAGTRPAPLIMRWVEAAIFWPLPLRFFAALYGLVFAYALALLWLVPPRWRARGRCRTTR